MIDLTPGQVLGDRFALVRRVSEGRAAEVWLAEDREEERRVALKVFEARLLDAPGAEARLRAEVDVARQLPFELVVPVLGLHCIDGLVVLGMDYLPGGDLGQFRGRSFQVFVPALDRVAEALAAAHERGLVHRDLKCANVLLDADGRARLADFGLATWTGAVQRGGSPYNMSPQQLRGEAASPADDLYAFGAMLFELLSGHPPYYPEITTERVLHEPVPPLIPRLPAPERLRELALRLLAKSPADRPASMQQVRRQLAEALREPAEDRPPEPSRPSRERPARPPATAGRPRGSGISRSMGTAAVVALVVVALGVFLWLPDYVERRRDATGDDAVAAALADAERLKSEEQDRVASAQARAAAEQARQGFEQTLATVEARRAATWATAELATARGRGAEASRSFDLGRYAEAAAAWEDATQAVDAIDGRRPEALAAAIEAGRQALARGQSAAAAEAFGLALAIEPGDAAAEAGLRRTQTLDEVLAAVDEGGREERAGRYAEALAAYRRALTVDAEAPGAREGIDRVTRRQSDDAFAAVVSRGMAALAAGRGEEARAAFERAGAMRPGSPEVRDALAQLERDDRAATLRALTERAEAAERAERWPEAREAWSEALSLEPTLAPAQAGLDRVVPRVGLDERMDKLFDEPERLWQPAGRSEAESLLAAAATAPPPRQLLARRAASLAEMLRAAQTPVRVSLESDGVTEVVIYRVGRMGSFLNQQVELMPGRYAVVGSRPGYRDVREEVVVRPGAAPDPVVVRCEEPI